ncbi:hypothetical protein CPAV1605_746 [seawater metagenome]|uniref:Uncharacterized protein n=1 Tax=seawater metagenome TaxID=1561972 RepID=A0A5E8CII4_9ZZZZ
MYYFILANILFILILIAITYLIRNYKLQKENKKTINFFSFLYGKPKSIKNLLLGLVFGFFFGFLDNFGLWIGLKYFEKYITGGIKTKATLGNTYSNVMGATIGTCLSFILKDLYDYQSTQDVLWHDPVGILLGCIIGILVGKYLIK